MSVLAHRCTLCGKELKKGDSAIKLDAFRIYHSDCYKRDQEKTYEEIGLFDQRCLREARSYLDALKALVNSESIGNSKSFYEAWGNQLFCIDLLGCIIISAEISGSLGFLQKIRLKRIFEKYRKTVMEIGTSYLEDYSNIQVERQIKELYPSSGEPTLEQLKEGEREALEMIRSQITELCNGIDAFYGDLKKLSNKTIQKAREQIKRQIQEIPKQVKIL